MAAFAALVAVHPSFVAAAGRSAELRDLLAYACATATLLLLPRIEARRSLRSALSFVVVALATTAVLDPPSRLEAPVLLALALATSYRWARATLVVGWVALWFPSLRAAWHDHPDAHTFEEPLLRTLRATFPACIFLPLAAPIAGRDHRTAQALAAFVAFTAIRGVQHPVVLLVPLCALLTLWLANGPSDATSARRQLGRAFFSVVAGYLLSRELADLRGSALLDVLHLRAAQTGVESIPAQHSVALAALTVTLVVTPLGLGFAAHRATARYGLAGLAGVATLGWTYSLSAHVERQTARGALRAYDRERAPNDVLLATASVRNAMANAGVRAEAVTKPEGANAIVTWLSEPGASEHWVAGSRAELPALSFEYRKLHHRNLPTVYADEAFFLTRSKPPAPASSPLDEIVGAAQPSALRGPRTELEGSLVALGILLQDEKGRPIATAKTTFRIQVVFQVGAPLQGAYCTFVHIDHTPSRFSAEHRTLAYPMPYWLPGDVVTDTFDVSLPTHFRKGSYPIYYGLGQLPCEDDRRMAVRGSADGRISGGRLVVP